jgi:hypothetical protein
VEEKDGGPFITLDGGKMNQCVGASKAFSFSYLWILIVLLLLGAGAYYYYYMRDSHAKSE